MRLRPRSSAASATLASRTKPTTPTTSRRYSSRKWWWYKRGRVQLSPFFSDSVFEGIGKRGIMKHPLPICAALLMAFSAASAQLASHAPTAVASVNTPPAAAASVTAPQVSDKPVARVNGAVLTDRDLLREMYAIFPYAQQHNGFPKAQEAAIRQGALEMIIFEELVYQEAVRRKLSVPAEKLSRAEADFRKQFNSPDQYQQYLQAEMRGSEQQLRQQIKRSLLIEEVMKSDVGDKSAVSVAEARDYYNKHPQRFQQP